MDRPSSGPYTFAAVTDEHEIRRWLGHHAERVLAARGDAEQLAAVLAATDVPMVVVDDERRYVDANEHAWTSLGVSHDELLRMRVDDVTPPYRRDELEENWARLLETGVLLQVTVTPERLYGDVPHYSLANVLPGRHVIVFVPHAVTPDDLPRDGGDSAQEPAAPLTPRELEVLGLAANGLIGPKIADELVLSPATVRTHFENIYRKLNAPDRAAAVAKAMRLGLIR
jgi:PAS domain S-box-containing protein